MFNAILINNYSWNKRCIILYKYNNSKYTYSITNKQNDTSNVISFIDSLIIYNLFYEIFY